MENTLLLDIEKIHLAHEFVLDRVHRCEYRKGRGLYGLVYVIRGEAQYRFVSGERLLAKQGDVLFISSECAYSISTEGEFLHYTVNFSLHSEDRVKGGLPSYLLSEGQGGVSFESDFKRLIFIWRSKEPLYEMICVGQLYILLARVLREYSGKGEQTYLRLLPARSHIEKHFDKELSLQFLAGLCNMSVTNFRREWKKHFGDTPLAYRDSIRLSLAKEYLGSGYYSVKEVASKCGFEDASYFVRFFKNKSSVTPREFANS